MSLRQPKRVELLFPLLAILLAWLGGCGHAPGKPANLRLEQAVQLGQQGQRAYQRGDAGAAAGYFEAALRVDISIENHHGIVADRLNLAQALDALGDAAAARRQLDTLLADRALPLDAEQRARANAALALLALKQGGPEEAARLAGEASLACAATCASAAVLYNIQARIALERGESSVALTLANQALPLLTDASRQAERANAFRIIGLARLARGETAAALDPLQQALRLDRELGLPERIVDDLLQLGRAHAAAGNADMAGDFRRRALAVAEAAADAALVSRVREQQENPHAR